METYSLLTGLYVLDEEEQIRDILSKITEVQILNDTAKELSACLGFTNELRNSKDDPNLIYIDIFHALIDSVRCIIVSKYRMKKQEAEAEKAKLSEYFLIPTERDEWETLKFFVEIEGGEEAYLTEDINEPVRVKKEVICSIGSKLAKLGNILVEDIKSRGLVK